MNGGSYWITADAVYRYAALDAPEAALPGTLITRPATCDNGGGGPQPARVQSLHNALGQRVAKTVGGDPATAIHFIYDQNGQVIAEIDAATGQTLRKYVYVNGVQIALVDDTGTAGEATYFVRGSKYSDPFDSLIIQRRG